MKHLPPIHKSHPQTTPPEVVEKIKEQALAHPAYPHAVVDTYGA